MFVPLPLLILAGFAFAVLLVLALWPRGRSDDLLAAPRYRLPRMTAPPGRPVDLAPDARVEVERLLGAGQVIDAIELVRQATGLGLKEAKDTVDTMRPTGFTTR